MGDPRLAPYGSVRLADVDTLAQVDPGNPDINDCDFHLVRRHFDVQAFGVNAATGNAGDEMVVEHHEADDEENRTNGHQELFAVMTGHAVFTVDGEEIDAPAGTIVFVRDPRCSAPPGQPPTARRSSWSEDPSASRTPSRAGKHRCRSRANAQRLTVDHVPAKGAAATVSPPEPPPSSRGRRFSPLRRRSASAARTRSATWRRRRGSPRR